MEAKEPEQQTTPEAQAPKKSPDEMTTEELLKD